MNLNELLEMRSNLITGRKAELVKEINKIELKEPLWKEDLDNYLYYNNQLRKLNERTAKMQASADPLRTAYELYEKMAKELTRECNATVADDKIYVGFFGQDSLSFSVRLIAAMYGIEEGAFTFDSSFTTHEAYTHEGWRINIGLSEDRKKLLIDFKFSENDIKRYLQIF